MDLDRLEAELVAHVETASAHEPLREFSAAGCCVHAQTPLYAVQLNAPRRRAAHGAVRISVIAKGALKRRLRTSIMCSVAQVRGAFQVARCLETYPQLKKQKASLKFGYRLQYPGLLEKRPEAKEITELTEDMQDNFLDKMKKGMGM